jgi:hypothetical protein
LIGAQAGGENAGADTWSPIRTLFTSLPPVLAALNDQTGMKAPGWMMNQPDAQVAEPEMLESKERALSNSTASSF